MEAALAIAFGLIIVAPFFGRWRANLWLKAHMPDMAPATNAGSHSSSVAEIA